MARKSPQPTPGQRAAAWVRTWFARRQGHYAPEDSPADDWRGRGGHERHKKGWRAERYAARRLWALGYHILERNVTVGRGELDIIAEKDDVLVFIEVKSGHERPDYTPADRVDASKRKQLTRLGNDYINQRGLGDVSHRYDIVEVFLDQRDIPIRMDIHEAAI